MAAQENVFMIPLPHNQNAPIVAHNEEDLAGGRRLGPYRRRGPAPLRQIGSQTFGEVRIVPRSLNPEHRSRMLYTRHQKERALRLIDQGATFRRAAAQIDPQCSPGTVCRWKKRRDIRRRIVAEFQRLREQRGGRFLGLFF